MDIDINSGELPYNVEAEQAVLGVILLHPEELKTAMQYIKPDSFYVETHKKLFAIIIRQFSLGVNSDVITVINEAVRENIFENSSAGKEYLAKIADDNNIFTANLENYCKIIEDKYYVRQLILTAREIITAASGQEPADDLLDLAEQKIYDIRQGKNIDGLMKIDEAVISVYDELGKRSGPDKELYLGVKSGFSDLDNMITGLNKSDLLIIAARPAMGKSAFALNIAANVARHNRSSEVVVFSLEMSTEQIVTRMLSAESLVENDHLLKGNISGEEWVKIAQGADRLSEMNIYLDDTPGITTARMKAKLRRMNNLGLVIIDYLQLMNSGHRSDNRVNEISEITRQLKLMAKDLKVPVIALSQLSRSVESRTDKRPLLSDLRESGSIEQDADIVMFLYRDWYYNKATPDPTATECIIAKNRHGETGTSTMRFNGEYTLFVGMDKISKITGNGAPGKNTP